MSLNSRSARSNQSREEKGFFNELEVAETSLDVHHVQKVGIKRFWAQEAVMSLTAVSSLESVREKFLMNSRYISQKVGIKRFWAVEAEMNLTATQPARISERKNFHELDAHQMWKVGIKHLWAQEGKLSLTVNSSLKSARKKFFMNSTLIMSRKQESNVFGLRRPK